MPELQEIAKPESAGPSEEPWSQSDRERSRFKDSAARVVQNGKTAAQRWGRQGLHAAEDLAGTARNRIEHDPVRSAVASLLIGVSLGALITWSIRHRPGAPDA